MHKPIPASVVEGIATLIHGRESILDMGAGHGRYVKALRELGYDIKGIDGTPGIEVLSEGLVQEVDLAGGLRIDYVECADWGLCIDVGEHIQPDWEDVFFNNICRMIRSKIIISWGPPGCRGSGHVNCKTLVYVASEMARRKWFVNENLTVQPTSRCRRGLC
jgi:hypothetical protein